MTKVLGNADDARRLVLSLFFRAVLGIQRIFHFETLDDVGFALLSGGRRVVSRSRLGGLVRATTPRAAERFARLTEQLGALRGRVATLSLDEHAIARFTRKFRIAKGFHTIRNKHMKIEKLFFLYWPACRRFLTLVVARGDAALGDLIPTVLRGLQARVRVSKVRLILDAAAAHSHADLARLHRFRTTVFLIRAPRRRAYTVAWQGLPRAAFSRVEEPGRYRSAKPKVIHVAETTTPIACIRHPVRTIVVREQGQRGKDRWHALFILHDDTTAPLDLVHEFRTRQHHEQGYRIGVHDLWMDTAPSGYSKRSAPGRPAFHGGPLTLCAWITALAWDALREMGKALPRRFHLAHPRTLRRWVLLRDAELIVTPSHLLVVLDSAHRRPWLRPMMRKLNAAGHRLPWFGDRRVAMGFAARGQPLADARPVLPPAAELGSEGARLCGGVWC